MEKITRNLIKRLGLQPEYDIVSGIVQIPKQDFERFGFVVMCIGCAIGFVGGIIASLLFTSN